MGGQKVNEQGRRSMSEAKAGIGTWIMPCLGLCLLWILMIAVAHPLGEFPLNDDWNYARSVQALLSEHKLLITQWSLAASLTNIVIGWLACLVSGFSFHTLRLSSQILGLACGLGTFALLKKQAAPTWLACLGALTLISDPLFFQLSNTFMTDIGFLAVVVAALYLSAEMIRQKTAPGAAKLAGLSFLCVAICLSRQTGLVVPVGLLLTRVFSKRLAAMPLWQAAVPLVVSTAAICAFESFLSSTTGELMSYRAEVGYWHSLLAGGVGTVAATFAANVLKSALYLGLLLLPLLLYCYPAFLVRLASKERSFAIVLMLEIFIFAGAGLVATNNLMPLADNVIFSGGLGPLLLRDDGRHIGWIAGSPLFWACVTLLSCAGAGCLLSMVAVAALRFKKRISILPDAQSSAMAVLLLSILSLYLSLLCFRGFFDRYLIFPLLLCIPLLVSATKLGTADDTAKLTPLARRSIACGCACLLLVFAGIDAACVHDYFAFNRSRWQALGDLLQTGISPMDIDGGLEFNGWYGYEPAYRKIGIVFDTNMTHNDRFVLSLTTLPGFDVFATYSFKRWLPSGIGQILVLKKQATRL